jgi:hypothetical protein
LSPSCRDLPEEDPATAHQKRKFADVFKGNFPKEERRNEVELPFSVNESTFQTCLHKGCFVVRFAKRRDLGKKKLVMNIGPDSDME